MAHFFIFLAGAIHVTIFLMESILWGTSRINRVFGVGPEQAEQNRLFAFNQGFYNLFLAIAAFAGIVITKLGHQYVGSTLITYSMLSMLGAAIVLLFSNRKLIKAALIQGLPPLLGLLFWFALN